MGNLRNHKNLTSNPDSHSNLLLVTSIFPLYMLEILTSRTPDSTNQAKNWAMDKTHEKGFNQYIGPGPGPP